MRAMARTGIGTDPSFHRALPGLRLDALAGVVQSEMMAPYARRNS